MAVPGRFAVDSGKMPGASKTRTNEEENTRTKGTERRPPDRDGFGHRRTVAPEAKSPKKAYQQSVQGRGWGVVGKSAWHGRMAHKPLGQKADHGRMFLSTEISLECYRLEAEMVGKNVPEF